MLYLPNAPGHHWAFRELSVTHNKHHHSNGYRLQAYLHSAKCTMTLTGMDGVGPAFKELPGQGNQKKKKKKKAPRTIVNKSRQDVEDLLYPRAQATPIFRGIEKTDGIREALCRNDIMENTKLGTGRSLNASPVCFGNPVPSRWHFICLGFGLLCLKSKKSVRITVFKLSCSVRGGRREIRCD